MAAKAKTKSKHTITPEGKANIAKAQKARWRKWRAARRKAA